MECVTHHLKHVCHADYAICLFCIRLLSFFYHPDEE
jgi:hypothetical protein